MEVIQETMPNLSTVARVPPRLRPPPTTLPGSRNQGIAHLLDLAVLDRFHALRESNAHDPFAEPRLRTGVIARVTEIVEQADAVAIEPDRNSLVLPIRLGEDTQFDQTIPAPQRFPRLPFGASNVIPNVGLMH
jgi:hypothetical protein